jgi:peptidoglycan/xylan/chitin deacetylase (PgdA/CDA1 family)
MKRSKLLNLDQTYKKNIAGIFAEIKLLFSLIGLLTLFILAENFSFLVSQISQVGVEQVLAINEVENAEKLMSPTPTPSESVLFSMNALAATLTPTPTPLHHQPQGDFCLNVPIFMYHHTQPMNIAVSEGHGQLTVDSNTFDAHMSHLLSKGYTMVSTAEIVDAVLSHRQLPEKSIAITIDDGYKDNYEYAYQTAKKYNIKMDFMIPTGLIGNPGYMTWDDLKDMSQNPLVTIYNHTWSHTSMGAVDRVTIESEVTTAQKQLEENLGIKNPIFVYPYGSYSPLAIEVLREKGFIAAVTTIQGTLQCKSTIMEMQRTRIGNTHLNFYGF